MRYQIRCVCGHLSAFEIVPMPVEPSHKDKKISDEYQRITQLEAENEALKKAGLYVIKTWNAWGLHGPASEFVGALHDLSTLLTEEPTPEDTPISDIPASP